MTRLLLFLAALLLAAAPAAAQSGGGGNIVAPVNVRVLKPLQLSAIRDLDFGTIVMRPFSGVQDVSVTAGGRTCGTGGLLSCIGPFATAQFQLSGSNRERVLINSPGTITLRNGRGGSLSLILIHPSSVMLPNSGNKGMIVEVGGRLQIPADAPYGLYTGTLEIEVAYQ